MDLIYQNKYNISLNESFEKPKTISDIISPETKFKNILKTYSKPNEYGNPFDEGGVYKICKDVGYINAGSYELNSSVIPDIETKLYKSSRKGLISDFIISKDFLEKNIFVPQSFKLYRLEFSVYVRPNDRNVLLIFYDYEKMQIFQCKKRKINYLYESGYYGSGYSLNADSGTNIIGNRPPYEYEIVPLNHNLEQKQTKMDNEYYIHPGLNVIGFSIKDNRKIKGIVYRIVKNTDGTISFVYLQDPLTGTFVKVKPELTIIKN